MDVLIAGAGSVGSVIGVLLASSEHNVVFLRRRPPFGKTKIKIFGQQNLTKIVQIIDKSTLATHQFDIIFITTQAQHTASLLSDLDKSGIITPRTLLVSLQNGIHGPTRLCSKFPDSKIIVGTVWWSATMYNPFEIYYHRQANTTLGIPRCSKAQQEDLSKTVKLLNALQNISTTDDVTAELRKKLILNVVSPVLALAKKPYPTGLLDPTVRKLVHLLFDDALQVAEKEGWKVVDDRLIQFHRMLDKSDEEIREAMKSETTKEIQDTKYQHKVSTLLGLEKYGNKGSNVRELLGPFANKGSEISKIIVQVVETYTDEMEDEELLNSFKGIIEKFDGIPCKLGDD